MFALQYILTLIAVLAVIICPLVSNSKWEDYKKSANKAELVESLLYAFVAAFALGGIVVYYLMQRGLIQPSRFWR